MRRMAIKCAFCKGTGKDPLRLLSEAEAESGLPCLECGGKGVLAIKE